MDKEEPKLNNARVKTFGSYIIVHSYEPVIQDEDDSELLKINIWKGIQLVQPEQRSELMPEIYFSRSYYPKINDLDFIFPEIVWDDKELIGVPCLFVQKEKLIFGYQPSPKGGILLPPPKSIVRRPRQ